MAKPNRLKRGDKVAIVSLSSGILGESFVKHELNLGIKRMQEFGLVPVFMNNTLKGLDFISKHPEARADDLKQAFADDEIKLHIETCCQYLISTGVPDDVVSSENPLVEGLILIYVKTFFGFKADGSVKELPASFHLLVRQLVFTSMEV